MINTPWGNHIIGYSLYSLVLFKYPISIKIFLLIANMLFASVTLVSKEELKLIVLLIADLPSIVKLPLLIIPWISLIGFSVQSKAVILTYFSDTFNVSIISKKLESFK